MKRIALMRAASAGMALCLTACGGGGGGSELASTPPPPTTPTPTPTSSAVDIFQSPASQEFAVTGTGSDLRIRYDAATNRYEVNPGNQGWVALLDDPLFSPLAGNPNTNFVFAGSPVNQSNFLIRAHYSYTNPDLQYLYSNLAPWSGQGLGGYVAFGMATPPGGVPATGNATYNGMIEGVSTEKYSSPWDYGDESPAHIAGSIKLAFSFGSGSLSGSISPTLYLGTDHQLGTFNFVNTVFSAGSTSFSGRFDTATPGSNSFSGLFTGPNAQELIGKFALPYVSPVDGTSQQSQGAFIAKK